MDPAFHTHTSRPLFQLGSLPLFFFACSAPTHDISVIQPTLNSRLLYHLDSITKCHIKSLIQQVRRKMPRFVQMIPTPELAGRPLPPPASDEILNQEETLYKQVENVSDVRFALMAFTSRGLSLICLFCNPFSFRQGYPPLVVLSSTSTLLTPTSSNPNRWTMAANKKSYLSS